MSANDNDGQFLTGQILIAMPNMGDSRFKKAVILLCAHDENGAMGLVLNQIMPDINLAKLLGQLNITIQDDVKPQTANIPVMNGGPVETARGFVLHSQEFHHSDTIKINDQLSVTGTADALRSIAQGNDPQKMSFLLG